MAIPLTGVEAEGNSAWRDIVCCGLSGRLPAGAHYPYQIKDEPGPRFKDDPAG